MITKPAVHVVLACVSLSLLCGMSSAPTGSSTGASSVRKGDMLRPARSAARSNVASFSVTGGDGQEQIVMRTRDGREAYRTDRERAFTVVSRDVEVPPLPESPVVARTAASVSEPVIRRSAPIGCERALSGLVKASAMSPSRCLT